MLKVTLKNNIKNKNIFLRILSSDKQKLKSSGYLKNALLLLFLG